MLNVVAINAWWAEQSNERFWMEITDRDDLGHDLRAPQTNGTGGEEWSYTLVTYTRPGDIVLHWHKTLAGEPAIVGWSEVTGPLSEGSMEWLAHGTRGRARGRVETVSCWVQELGGLHTLARPVVKPDLTSHRRAVLDALGGTERATSGAIYPPFYEYGGRELRAMQSYLTKVPAALIEVLRQLGLDLPRTATGKRPAETRAARGARQGRQGDPVLLRATERYAVEAAKAHYMARGAISIKELGKPYDLDVRIDGGTLHVEVKGTTTDGAVAVILTANEVIHAREYPTELFVLDGITYTAKSDGTYELGGGRQRVWPAWTPDPDDLEATEYRYTLPD